MYIQNIIDVNVGPLKNIHLKCPFNADGTPKPIVIVGENGTGKSTLLSNIVDAFLEIASLGYQDALHALGTGGWQYYKAISGMEISFGEKYMYSYINFDDNKVKGIEYVFKSGVLSQQEFKQKVPEAKSNFTWDDEENVKDKKVLGTTIAEKVIRNILNTDILCYFKPDRYEKPFWLGSQYYDSSLHLHPTVKMSWFGKLKNPIMPSNMTQSLLPWLLDIIVDSRMEIIAGDGKVQLLQNQLNDVYNADLARQNVETIMSRILGEEVVFGLNFRNKGGTRFNIRQKSDDGQLITNSLDGLSTGQSALFDMFATIVKYADDLNVMHSVNLDEIKGIVAIDEIELHLHSNLQRDVLPKLIKLFPRVQFIITTHSPLFLLGMEEEFGTDGYVIYQMPEGKEITAERFSEFQKAYKYLTQTETYEKEIEKAISEHTQKMLVVTEGSTDWKHLKAAFNELSSKAEYKDIFDELNFEFLEYTSKKSDTGNLPYLEMGNKALVSMCEGFSKVSQPRKIVFIADCDDDKTSNRLSFEGKDFKKFGNKVYSFTLPVPEVRKKTPKISIEHLYPDEVIKTEVIDDETEIARRIYMGNEFDHATGLSFGEPTMLCIKKDKCGPDKIGVIDGSEDERVVSVVDKKINRALAKSLFADMILNRKPPFDHVDFSNFLKIFEILKQIAMDED